MKQELINLLQKENGAPIPVLAGMDGFVDEIIYVVDKRLNAEEFVRIPTLTAYGQRIINCAGLSTNFENVVISRKLGGNGTIFSLGLKKLGAKITYIGAVGDGNVHPIFSELAEGAEFYGLCDPAQTDAIEFEDGKLICSKIDTFKLLTWERIKEYIGIDKLAGLLDRAKLISFNNWTMVHPMTEFWEHLQSDVVPCMKVSPAEKTMFFDLADPEKRKNEDIAHALELIDGFRKLGFHVVLGLNLKEANEVVGILETGEPQTGCNDAYELLRRITAKLPIECLVIHEKMRASCIRDGVCCSAPSRFCAKPKLATGAGDNFNAGFMYGYMRQYPMEHCLLCGVSTAGFYVRAGRNADPQDLIDFLAEWGKEQ